MADLFKTRTQLKERAAKDLAIIEPGEALSTEDDATFDGLIDPLLAQLSVDKIAYIGDSEEIPLELFLPLARLLANMAGPDFGSPINEEARIADEKTLRRLTTAVATTETVRAKYF
jgi:hypothetical protein